VLFHSEAVWTGGEGAPGFTVSTRRPGGGTGGVVMYGDSPDYERQDGTDLAAIAEGRVAVTPLHFDLTDRPGIETLQAYDLARLLAPAAEELD